MDDLSVGTRAILWAVGLLVAVVVIVLFHHLGFNPLGDFISLMGRLVDGAIGPSTAHLPSLVVAR